MKAIKTLLVAALAATGLGANLDAYAQEKHGARGHGGRHWHGGHGHHGHRHGGHWRGHFGLFIGAPLAFGWGAPWHYDPWYYGPTVVYREREVIREPADVVREPATTQIPRTEGAPKQGPMYMNYCESAKAYYPKVTSCPEGWRLTTPTQ